jgi:dolichol kinase
MVIAFGSGFLLSHIEGSGTFAETSKRIAASEHLYRAALSAIVIVTLASALLAFALYATLKPVNSLLAQLAMIFTLADSFIALVVRMCSFVQVHLYLAPQPAVQPLSAQSLSELMRTIANTTENLGGISFGIGSFLFFYLFFQSRYIPRALSALGLFASALWTCAYFANLIFPEQHRLFQYISFLPMGLAEVTTGLYLLLFSIRIKVPCVQPAPISG